MFSRVGYPIVRSQVDERENENRESCKLLLFYRKKSPLARFGVNKNEWRDCVSDARSIHRREEKPRGPVRAQENGKEGENKERLEEIERALVRSTEARVDEMVMRSSCLSVRKCRNNRPMASLAGDRLSNGRLEKPRKTGVYFDEKKTWIKS
ncbi:hypothetical protein WR25_05267 [Diploscapter pachys]|uniref:Uncharacterized protein n=1 Tax=Diploscapter pachys TaxID=2018661 RepID=A0A2A2LSE9_9BILA|nr:hypothetical protein WR25_05267 [Diploscapter pachys]